MSVKAASSKSHVTVKATGTKTATKSAQTKSVSGTKNSASKVAVSDASYVEKGAPIGLRIGTVRAPEKVVSTDAIPSAFPIDALGDIKTVERWGAGFRLDSGSLRLMWMNVRRIHDDGKKGYELNFFLHANAVQTFKERLEDLGAKKSTFSFQAGDPEGPKDRSFIKKKTSKWSPSEAAALMLKQPGKWSVELCPDKPEALKGAMRIRVMGSDAEASKVLKGLQNKLGLQSLFAPPTPKALERFKLFRLLWATDPTAADKLRWRSIEDVGEQALRDALDAAATKENKKEIAEAVGAIDGLDLKDPKIRERFHLARALLSKSFKAFADWAEDGAYSKQGILPEPPSWSYSSSYNYESAGLKDKLQELGVKTDSKTIENAGSKPITSANDAKELFLLGLLIRKDKAAATALMSRSPEDVKLEDLKAALSKSGVDPSSARVKNLRFEEVYPGYFTVVDPALSDRCAKAGARYLYSTLDDPERVYAALTGGQKSSLARFHEGVLIHGKSTASDFPTGGAFGVFTRLVTDSIIKKAKKDAGKTKSYSWSSDQTEFNDWSGSRPYKLILNRRILGRLDWWGHHDDEYGRFTGLTEDNHAEKLVKGINDDYSSSNELMFPVGNDPSYVDLVVCSDEDQKEKLIEHLEKRGLKKHKGKSLSDLIKVSTYFFEHPDDK